MKAPLPPIPSRQTKTHKITTKAGAVIKALSAKDLHYKWGEWLRTEGERPVVLDFINGSVLFNEIAGITKE